MRFGPLALAVGSVTATARKIAVLFYNSLRNGMAYHDPGATQYEERYRSRVIGNLQRRARAFGFFAASRLGSARFCWSKPATDRC